MQSNKSFLQLLLSNNDKRQQNGLMQTISLEQLNVLGEIFYNLLNIVPLDKKEEKIVKKKKKILQKLSLLSKSYNSRRKLLLANKSALLKTLLSFKDKLLHVINSLPLLS